ncbi:MAG: hypothetical protein ACRDDY_13875 [Clostridium sp.]|uniref:hypothetical protein n=1 Tax=Clostridium sp. TaxID=1506 RepID=UPI003EE710C9
MNSELEELLNTDAAQAEDGVEMPLEEPKKNPAPQQKERREVQQPKAQNPVNDKPPLRKANPDMFNKVAVVGPAHNPARVSICKDTINRFNHECRKVAENVQLRASATSGLYNTFRSLTTLNRDDVHEVLQHLLDTIKSSETGAFERTLVFSNVHHLKASERELMIRMLHLMTVYAETVNPKAVRRRANPSYAVSLYASEATRLNIDSFFPEE